MLFIRLGLYLISAKTGHQQDSLCLALCLPGPQIGGDSPRSELREQAEQHLTDRLKAQGSSQ